MSLLVVLLIVLLVASIGSAPVYPYSRAWGYYPSGGTAIVAVIVILYLLFGAPARI